MFNYSGAYAGKRGNEIAVDFFKDLFGVRQRGCGSWINALELPSLVGYSEHDIAAIRVRECNTVHCEIDPRLVDKWVEALFEID
jgi:hypothetical protein